MSINSIINASIQKAPFEVPYGKKKPLPIDLLLSRESFINPYVHKLSSKMKQLIYKVKSAMNDV